MKVRKGKLKLDSNEKRVGNFVLRKEADYMKICDISRVFIYSISRRKAVGLFLSQSYDSFTDEHVSKGLESYIAVLFAVYSTVPDIDFLKECYASSESCINRHPEAYGRPSVASEAADADAVESVKEMKELEEDAKKLIENAGE